jgi:hypothetical protein
MSVVDPNIWSTRKISVGRYTPRNLEAIENIDDYQLLMPAYEVAQSGSVLLSPEWRRWLHSISCSRSVLVISSAPFEGAREREEKVLSLLFAGNYLGANI